MSLSKIKEGASKIRQGVKIIVEEGNIPDEQVLYSVLYQALSEAYTLNDLDWLDYQDWLRH